MEQANYKHDEDEIKDITAHIEEAESLSRIIMHSMFSEAETTEMPDIINSLSVLTNKLTYIKNELTKFYSGSESK